jgi:hypothetical protein
LLVTIGQLAGWLVTMRKRRLRFFWPRQTADFASQTDFSLAPAPAADSRTISRLRRAALESLLMQETVPFAPLDRSALARCASHVAYFSGRSDPRFDPFPESSLLVSDRPTAATFSLYDDHAVLSNGDDTRAIEFDYRPPHLAIIQSLQSGSVGIALFHLLEQVAAGAFTDGEIIIAIRDFRATDPREVRVRLKPGPELLRFVLQRAQPDESTALEHESTAVRIAAPVVCTDPSPDVARFAAAIDFRKKMWQNPGNTPMQPPVEIERPDAVPNVVRLVPLREPVRLPRAIADAFARFPGAAKLSENKRKS